ncbi:MAG TPA: DUF305 domain-containing protein [Gemmatimonadaceae bacterium]|nr:DUF305 domain-containing protein [Gemmatimonadaceae bacterium]
MNALRSRGRVATLVCSAALLAVAPRAWAQNPTGMGSHDMAGMDMGSELPPVTIPKNAIFTEADVRFMQGMIAHHAQAIYMANLAAAHDASPRLLKFTQKIAQSQTAEIKLMQDWLRAKNQFAPDTSSWHHMMMSGMLSAAQIDSLGAAKGPEFDRLFLRFMIQHHEGAITMVHDLFSTPLAGQDVDVSVFANDVETVQTAEIGTMYRMLNAL